MIAERKRVAHEKWVAEVTAAAAKKRKADQHNAYMARLRANNGQGGPGDGNAASFGGHQGAVPGLSLGLDPMGAVMGAAKGFVTGGLLGAAVGGVVGGVSVGSKGQTGSQGFGTSADIGQGRGGSGGGGSGGGSGGNGGGDGSGGGGPGTGR